MAWALRFDSSLLQYCVIQTPVNETSTQWRVEWRAKLVDGTSLSNRIIAKLSGSTDYIRTRHTSTQEELILEINDTVYNITGGDIVTNDGDFHDYKLVSNGSQLEYFIDEVSKGTTAGSPVFEDMQAIGRGGSSYFNGDVEYFKYYDTSSGDVLKFNWDATASDHSNTGLQPVIIDTIGGNNATGVNFPTDGSAWIDLGGGVPEFSGAISPSFNLSSFLQGNKESFGSTLTQVVLNVTTTGSKETGAPVFSGLIGTDFDVISQLIGSKESSSSVGITFPPSLVVEGNKGSESSILTGLSPLVDIGGNKGSYGRIDSNFSLTVGSEGYKTIEAAILAGIPVIIQSGGTKTTVGSIETLFSVITSTTGYSGNLVPIRVTYNFTLSGKESDVFSLSDKKESSIIIEI